MLNVCNISSKRVFKVTELLKSLLVPPRWTLEPTDKAFAQGSDAKVECKADGFPKPVVTWKKATGISLISLLILAVNKYFVCFWEKQKVKPPASTKTLSQITQISK